MRTLCALLAVSLLLGACASRPRNDLVAFKGSPLTLSGDPEQLAGVGEPAPPFTAVANDLTERSLADYRGDVVILSTVPSLDTGVCDRETRTFNERAAALSDDVRIVTVSMDLPFAQARWCGANGVERVETLSDSKLRQVGDRYGLRIEENGLLARAVYVIDREGIVRYRQVVPELTSEPDYDRALGAAADLAADRAAG